MAYKRRISQVIDQELGNPQKRVLLLVGARQVGKTTELQRLQRLNPGSKYFDLQDYDARSLFSPSVAALQQIVGEPNEEQLLLLDEVQYLPEVGHVLKLLHDHFPGLRIVATGSAAFLMLKQIGDSLAGRKLTYAFHPLSLRELIGVTDQVALPLGGFSDRLQKATINQFTKTVLLYGAFPDIHLTQDPARRQQLLQEYTASVVLKDLLELEDIRHREVLRKLLVLLASYVTSEINPNTLANQLEITRKTVVSYIELFEQFQIIRILRPLHGKSSREVTKKFKVYFNDLGIRNALIRTFTPIETRADSGALFENLVFNTLRQHIDYDQLAYDMYFWRDNNGSEVDFVLRSSVEDQLLAIETKLSKKPKLSRAFQNLYGSSNIVFHGIDKDNFWKYV